MSYSIWTNDTLIGHTRLSYDVCTPEHRMGELEPTDAGLALLLENEFLDGLDLQLRDEGGTIIPTEHISTLDANRLARLRYANGLSTYLDVLSAEEGVLDSRLAVAKLELAESLPVRTIGAVLNCVRGRGAFRYYTYDMAGYTEPAPDELASGPRRDSWRNVLGGRS